jgi:hypothetical protein
VCATPTESRCYRGLSWRQFCSLLFPFCRKAPASSPPCPIPPACGCRPLPPRRNPTQRGGRPPLPPRVLSHQGAAVATYLPGTIRCGAAVAPTSPTPDLDGAPRSPPTSLVQSNTAQRLSSLSLRVIRTGCGVHPLPRPGTIRSSMAWSTPFPPPRAITPLMR